MLLNLFLDVHISERKRNILMCVRERSWIFHTYIVSNQLLSFLCKQYIGLICTRRFSYSFSNHLLVLRYVCMFLIFIYPFLKTCVSKYILRLLTRRPPADGKKSCLIHEKTFNRRIMFFVYWIWISELPSFFDLAFVRLAHLPRSVVIAVRNPFGHYI